MIDSAVTAGANVSYCCISISKKGRVYMQGFRRHDQRVDKATSRRGGGLQIDAFCWCRRREHGLPMTQKLMAAEAPRIR